MSDDLNDEAAIAAAKRVFLGVCSRAQGCTNKNCRRRRVCLAGWSAEPGAENMLYHPTGGCPVMTPEEWDVVRRGLARNRDRTLQILRAIHAERERLGVPRSGRPRPPEPAKSDPGTFAQFLWMTLLPDGRAVWPRRFERKPGKG